MKFLGFLAISVPYVLSAPHGPDNDRGSSSNQLTVDTSSGCVHGKIDPAQPQVRQFLGVPFAKPPVDDLRWEPPQPLPKSAVANSIEATELPPSCPQALTTIGNSVYKNDVLQFNLQGLNTTGAISEDCLTLSVWTPTLNQTSQEHHAGKPKLLPVLIFFYGGGYVTGGQDVPYQIPTKWVQRTQDHVVVSFNYRLNIFGFPNAAGLDDQNLAILDQRMAIEWIHQNIAQFGGDPSRLVMWGQSAGAGSVDYVNYAYYQDPIVSGMILDSGTALLPIASADTTHSNFSSVATHFNCSTASPSDELSCMRKIPFRHISTYLQTYSDAGTSPTLSFVPIPDNKLIFANYTARALANQTSPIPAIIGTNAQDGEPFAPYPLLNPAAGPNQTLVAQALLSTFLCPATETIRLRTDTNGTVFRYLYSGNFSNIAPRGWMGAYHSSELPLIMGTYDDFRGVGPGLEDETSEAMQDAWVAFARDGVLGLQGTGWRPYLVGEGTVREFGAGVAVRDTDLRTLEGECRGAVPG